jgi:hypothetical protein
MLCDFINVFRYPCDPLVNIRSGIIFYIAYHSLFIFVVDADEFKVPLMQLDGDDMETHGAHAIVS